MIKIYSKSADGRQKLSRHFTVADFACKDGADQIIIDDALVSLLERISLWAGKKVAIRSAFRTETYNARIGGKSDCYHLRGQAADIEVHGKTPAKTARYAQAIGTRGIGLHSALRDSFVHIDTRPKKRFWVSTNDKTVSVIGLGGSCPYAQSKRNLSLGSFGNDVRWTQWWLNLWDANILVDGKYGEETAAAVRKVQKKLGLAPDGNMDEKTGQALMGIIE